MDNFHLAFCLKAPVKKPKLVQGAVPSIFQNVYTLPPEVKPNNRRSGPRKPRPEPGKSVPEPEKPCPARNRKDVNPAGTYLSMIV